MQGEEQASSAADVKVNNSFFKFTIHMHEHDLLSIAYPIGSMWVNKARNDRCMGTSYEI